MWTIKGGIINHVRLGKENQRYPPSFISTPIIQRFAHDFRVKLLKIDSEVDITKGFYKHMNDL